MFLLSDDVVLWVLGALLVVVLVLLLLPRSVVPVGSATIVPLDLETVERLAFRPLGAIRRARMAQPFPGYVTLTTSWVPGWAVVVGILAFPIGLVAMLLARDHALLHIRISGHRSGTLVQVTGRSTRSVARAVGAIFDEMSELRPQGAQPAHTP